jgi:hypothetical protein
MSILTNNLQFFNKKVNCGYCVWSIVFLALAVNNVAMKEDRLRKMIKAMYLLREVLRQKQEDDMAFKFKPKSKVLNEVDEIIDRRLEEFYACRVN